MDADGIGLDTTSVDIHQISVLVANMLIGLLRTDSAIQAPTPKATLASKR